MHAAWEVLSVAHLVVFLGWLLSVTITANEPAWFLSGSLGFSTMCCFIVSVMVPLTRTKTRQIIDKARTFVPRSVEVAFDKAHRVPFVDAASASTLLIVAVAGLVPIGWYFANTFMARARPLSYASADTRELAAMLWHNNPGSTITMLILLSATALLHVIDAIVSVAILVQLNRVETETTKKVSRLL